MAPQQEISCDHCLIEAAATWQGVDMKEIVELITSMGPLSVLVFVALIGMTAGVICMIVNQIGTYATHRADVQLKRELVERGLSVEEIERIVLAKPVRESQTKRTGSVFADAKVGRS
jgi:hypothetical protein